MHEYTRWCICIYMYMCIVEWKNGDGTFRINCVSWHDQPDTGRWRHGPRKSRAIPLFCFTCTDAMFIPWYGNWCGSKAGSGRVFPRVVAGLLRLLLSLLHTNMYTPNTHVTHIWYTHTHTHKHTQKHELGARLLHSLSCTHYNDAQAHKETHSQYEHTSAKRPFNFCPHVYTWMHRWISYLSLPLSLFLSLFLCLSLARFLSSSLSSCLSFCLSLPSFRYLARASLFHKHYDTNSMQDESNSRQCVCLHAHVRSVFKFARELKFTPISNSISMYACTWTHCQTNSLPDVSNSNHDNHLWNWCTPQRPCAQITLYNRPRQKHEWSCCKCH